MSSILKLLVRRSRVVAALPVALGLAACNLSDPPKRTTTPPETATQTEGATAGDEEGSSAPVGPVVGARKLEADERPVQAPVPTLRLGPPGSIGKIHQPRLELKRQPRTIKTLGTPRLQRAKRPVLRSRGGVDGEPDERGNEAAPTDDAANSGDDAASSSDDTAKRAGDGDAPPAAADDGAPAESDEEAGGAPDPPAP